MSVSVEREIEILSEALRCGPIEDVVWYEAREARS